MKPNIKQIAKDCKQLIKEGRDAEVPLKHMFEEGVFTPEDFSIRDVAIASFGHEFIEACDPSRDTQVSRITEADGVDSTTFSNITGQIVFSKILQAFQKPELIGTSLIPTTPTRLNGEKLPGIGQLKDETLVVKEGMPYPIQGLDEEYLETPEIEKRGRIIPVTKEAIFFDRTNLVLARAAQVGEVLALNKEKRIIDSILGEASTFATGGKWKWKGTEFDVYNTNTVDFASYFYLNQTDRILDDYQDLDFVEDMFSKMQDPTTEEPILIPGARTLLVVPKLFQIARRIINSVETRKVTNTSVTTLSPADKGIYDIKTSPYFRSRLASNSTTSWWVGDFSKAFTYMENWPLVVSQAPTNNEKEFESDIVAQFKGSERGQIAVIAPQFVIKSTGAGS